MRFLLENWRLWRSALLALPRDECPVEQETGDKANHPGEILVTYALKWDEIQTWIEKSSTLLIKKLSRNDCAWADGAENGHQNGLYIPREIREMGFFPEIRNSNPDKPHIFDARFNTIWPTTGEIKSSALKHYSNKGPETHFTRVPRDQFRDLTPASWLLGGVLKRPEGLSCYWFTVLDSALPEAELLESAFELDSDFHSGTFDPSRMKSAVVDDAERLIDELGRALRDGTLPAFMASVLALPAPSVIAARAQEVYLAEAGLTKLDPYVLPRPGDVVMRISRDIEFALYKRGELRRRATDVVQILAGVGPDLVTSVVRGFPALNDTFLSASQQRKSRGGLSFELHVATLLRHGRIRFEEQLVTGSRRPDFVLPNVKELKRKGRPFDAAIVLAVKTTLRERWKQVSMEKLNSALFLATVDDRVTADAIADMKTHDICLVVPESLKSSKETCYPTSDNVISFRDFFDDEISRKRPLLRLPP